MSTDRYIGERTEVYNRLDEIAAPKMIEHVPQPLLTSRIEKVRYE